MTDLQKEILSYQKRRFDTVVVLHNVDPMVIYK